MKPKDIHTANKEIRDQTKISAASFGAKKDCLTPCYGQQSSTEVSVTGSKKFQQGKMTRIMPPLR